MRAKEEKGIYNSFELASIEELSDMSARPIRVTLPTSDENLRQMVEKGYCLVDRTLQAEINLKNDKIDFTRYARMPVERIVQQYGEEIHHIAHDCFQQDRRFFITLRENKALTDHMIDEYLLKVEECFVCLFKGVPAGFLSVHRHGVKQDKGFVYLAAVMEQYRRTGAAVSLYSFVAQDYKQRGFHSLIGRISSQNTAVMNLYVSLGAVFSKPHDVFIKG